MIKINVAEIKKRLVGKKDFSYELKPAELNITEADLPLTGTVTVKARYPMPVNVCFGAMV